MLSHERAFEYDEKKFMFVPVEREEKLQWRKTLVQLSMGCLNTKCCFQEFVMSKIFERHWIESVNTPAGIR